MVGNKQTLLLDAFDSCAIEILLCLFYVSRITHEFYMRLHSL